MNPQETTRIQKALDLLHRPPQQMLRSFRVEADVLISGLDPDQARDVDQLDTTLMRHAEALRELGSVRVLSA